MLDNQLLTCQNFLQVFLSNVNPDDQLPVKVSSSSICKAEVTGAITDWILQYLHQWSCPDFLITPLAKIILDEIRQKLAEEKCPFFNEDTKAYVSFPLMQYVVSKVQDVCKQYNGPEKLLTISLSDCILPIATFASKNKRRQMEDRHVIVNDLAKLFNRQGCQAISYYAIFDGHNGVGAANYSATHLHQFLAESQYFPIFPEQALTDAFKLTDKHLLEKLDSQVTRSGTTAVVALLNHDNRMLHVAWVGDSEALISSKGRVQRLVVPHKANRPDEIERVHKCGGTVLFWQTTYRVNGQLAISRSIGDADHKSCVISVPDIVSIQLEGDEDFIILACDGLWDCVDHDKAAKLVYEHVSSNPDRYEQTSQLLVEYAKEQGSADNITTIVVFLTHPRNIKCCDISMETATAESFSSNQNGAASYRPINNFDHDVDEDFGPETNVDNIDDLMSQPVPTKKSFLDTDTIKTSFAEQLQNDVLDHHVEAESKKVAAEETVKEILDNGKPNLDEESEEEEDDEGWDYFKADANSKSPNLSQQKLESSDDLSSNEMDYTLNPEAREFVPVSPTKEEGDSRSQSPDLCLYPVKNTEKLLKEEFIASSPLKGQEKNMDDVIVPSLDDFEKEIKKRPSNIMPRFDADEFPSNNVANHELNNGTALLEENSFDHDSTYTSTHAVFGDDSTYATNLDDVNEELIQKQDKPDITASVPNGDTFDISKPASTETTESHEPNQQNHLDDFISSGEAFENEDYPSIVEKEQSSPIKESNHFGSGDIFENGTSNVTYSRDSGNYQVEKEVPKFDELLTNNDHSDVFDCVSFNKDPVDEVIQKMSSFDCGTANEGSLIGDLSHDFGTAMVSSPTDNLFNGTNPFAAKSHNEEKENAEEKDIPAEPEFVSTSDDKVDFKAHDPFQSIFGDATAPQLSEFEKPVEETIQAEHLNEVEAEPKPAETASAPNNDISAQILDTGEYNEQLREAESTEILPTTPENQSLAGGSETPIGSVDMITPYIHDCTRLGDKHDSVHEHVERRHYDDLLPDDDDATKESDKLESELRESTGGKVEFDLGLHESANRFDRSVEDGPGDEYQSLLCNLVPNKAPALVDDKIVEETPSMEAAADQPVPTPQSSGIDELTNDEKPADGLATPPPTAAVSGDPEIHVSIAEAVDKVAASRSQDEQKSDDSGIAAVAAIGAVAAAGAAAAAVATTTARKPDPKKPYVIRKPDPNKPAAPKPAPKAPATKSTAPASKPAAKSSSLAAKKPITSTKTTTPTKPPSRPTTAGVKSTTPTTRTSLTAKPTTLSAPKPAPRPTAPKTLASPSKPRPPIGSLTSPRSPAAKPITNGDVSSTTKLTRKPLSTGVKKLASPTSAAPPASKPAVNLATRTSLAPKTKPAPAPASKPIAKRPLSASSSLSRTTTANKDSKDITNKRLSSGTRPTSAKPLPKTESKVSGVKSTTIKTVKKVSTPDSNNQTDSTKMNGNA